MSVRPWRAEIRFNKTGKMSPGSSGAGNVGGGRSKSQLKEFELSQPVKVAKNQSDKELKFQPK